MYRPQNLTPLLLAIGAVLITGAVAALPLFLAQTGHAQTTISTPTITPGKVRVIAQQVRNDAKMVEWRWRVIGDRHWSAIASDSLGSVTLSGGDASLKPEGGNNIYEIRIATLAVRKNGGTPHLDTESAVHQLPRTFRRADGSWLSFSDGRGSKGGGSDPLKKPVAANIAAHALFTGDKTFPLPLRLPLYERTFGQDGTPVSTKKVTSYLVVSP